MKRTLWTVLMITGCTGRSDLLEQLGFYPERCGGPCADDAEMVLRQEDGQVFVDFDAELWTFPQILQWEVSESADPKSRKSRARSDSRGTARPGPCPTSRVARCAR